MRIPALTQFSAPDDPSVVNTAWLAGEDSAECVDEALVSEVAALHDQLGELNRRIVSYRSDMPQKSAAVVANLKDHVSAMLDLKDRALDVRFAASFPASSEVACLWHGAVERPTCRKPLVARRQPLRREKLVPTRSPPFSRSIASLQTTSSHRKEATCVIPHHVTAQTLILA